MMCLQVSNQDYTIGIVSMGHGGIGSYLLLLTWFFLVGSVLQLLPVLLIESMGTERRTRPHLCPPLLQGLLVGSVLQSVPVLLIESIGHHRTRLHLCLPISQGLLVKHRLQDSDPHEAGSATGRSRAGSGALGQSVATLSGGQRALVSLALMLAVRHLASH